MEYDDSQDIVESLGDFSAAEFSEPELEAKLEDSSDSDSFDNFFLPKKNKKTMKPVTKVVTVTTRPVIMTRPVAVTKPVMKTSSSKEKNGVKGADGYFTCEQCSYRSKKTTSIQSHAWKMHNGPRPVFEFICELCSKDFRDKQGLKRHLNWHNNVIKFYCGNFDDICKIIQF